MCESESIWIKKVNSSSNKTRTQNVSRPHRVFSIGWYPYLLLRKAVTSSLSCSSWSWRVRASCSATSSWLHRLDWHPSWLSNACNSLACNQLLQGISRLGSSMVFTSSQFGICNLLWSNVFSLWGGYFTVLFPSS